MKNINLLLPNPLLIYHEKFSPRIAVPASLLIRPGFVQGNSCQAIQVCIRYIGKKTLSIEFIMYNPHNCNQGSRDKNPQHAKGGNA